ncbi:MAG TPA: alpha/beta fold hydrolase [Candidatus Acidoferrum sp.]|nr:alpha/beta fold hydrolase [Candidatus Acidoferrum sp.]
MIDRLTLLWEHALGRTGLRLDDNFFDLGGTPQTAQPLFSDIETLCGRKLPPFLLYHAPTPSAMAAALEKLDFGNFPRVIPLKAGATCTPIYIQPGMAGDPLTYFPLARRIETQRPVHVMQARGLGDGEKPHERVEDIARTYLETIRRITPQGPYLFIGISLGGLVAFEMAQQLAASGQEVAFLVILESYPYTSFLSSRERLLLRARVIKRHVEKVDKLSLGDGVRYVGTRLKRKLYDNIDASRHNPESDVPPFSPEMQRLRDGDYYALTHYQPRPYQRKIKFVRASIPTHFPDDPLAAWKGLADDMDVETVTGDHNGIVTVHFDELATVISRYLREAQL